MQKYQGGKSNFFWTCHRGSLLLVAHIFFKRVVTDHIHYLDFHVGSAHRAPLMEDIRMSELSMEHTWNWTL